MDPSAIVRSVLAADLACDEADLLGDGLRIVEARLRPGRRQFALPLNVFVMVTMGEATVVSCSASRLEWAHALLGELDRNQLFSASTIARIAGRLEQDGQLLAGPDLRFVCSEQDFRRPPLAPNNVDIDLVDGAAVADLYQHDGFRHALGYLTGSPRPDMVAAVATIDDRIVGLAGASADCDTMWQIGVDVIPDERNRGIGAAIVGRVTAEVLARGRVPYYCTVVSNIHSSWIALGLGYRLSWVDVYARDRPAQGTLNENR